MALQAEVAGWTSWDDEGPIPYQSAFNLVPEGESIQDVVDPSEVEGVWIRQFDPETGWEDYHWVWTYFALDWDEWDLAIDRSLDQYAQAQA